MFPIQQLEGKTPLMVCCCCSVFVIHMSSIKYLLQENWPNQICPEDDFQRHENICIKCVYISSEKTKFSNVDKWLKVLNIYLFKPPL